MNIEKIKEVVNNNTLPAYIQKQLILYIIAADREAVPMVLEMLNNEREESHNLILDSNLELSRALIALEDPNIGKKKPKPIIELGFVVGEIKNHYIKWQHKIKCCFNIKGLP